MDRTIFQRVQMLVPYIFKHIRPLSPHNGLLHRILDIFVKLRFFLAFPAHKLLGFPLPAYRLPRKKALLIGIHYQHYSENADSIHSILNGPHRDVEALRQLLIDVYGYKPEDIVVMMDSRKMRGTELIPTRANMLREMRKLVEDAQYGDRFVFHFSGHTTQMTNRSNTEEDQMDEAIVPYDDEDLTKVIIDNDLKKTLVDPLPVGTTLVAILDTCHSESLLDLEHWRCNRVYVPHLSKGQRKTDPYGARTGMVRKLAMLDPRTLYYKLSHWRDTIYVDIEAGRPDTSRLLHAPLTAEPESFAPADVHSPLSPLARKPWLTESGDAPCAYMSPESMYSRTCTGNCRPSGIQKPLVMSLASCTDAQLSWQDEHGMSMTMAIVKLLREDPHPTRKKLMTDIAYWFHDLSLRLHQWSETQKAKKRKSTLVLETNNFQDPQLASNEPLDLHVTFTL